MAKVRIGIIGVGSMGHAHAEGSRELEEAELVAVTDPAHIEGAGQKFAEEFGMEYEPSLEGLLARKDIDAVVVATPHSLHMQHSVMAMEAGKHVLVEKPMEVSLEKCDRMIKAAEKAGVKLMVAHSHRYWPGDVIAKNLIDEGAIGKIVMVRDALIGAGYRVPPKPGEPKRWQLDTELYGIGGLIAWGCHNMDRFRYWFESDAVEVYAHSWSLRTEVPGNQTTHMIMLLFENGISANLWYSEGLPQPGWPKRDTYCRAEIVGEEGLIDVNPYLYVRVARKGTGKWEDVYSLDGWPPSGPGARLDCFRNEDGDFVRSILDDTEPPVTGLDGRKAVEMVVAAYKSGDTGQVVKLPL